VPNATTSLRKISMEEKSQSGHFSVYYYVKCCTEARVPKITTTEGLYVIILTGLFLLFDGVAGHGDEDHGDDVAGLDLSGTLNNFLQFLCVSAHGENHPASFL